MLQKFIQSISIARAIMILSILGALLVVSEHFAYTGFAITFVLLATYFLQLRTQIAVKVIVLYVIILVLALFLVLRANLLLTFFNFVSLLYCLALISYPSKKPSKYNFFNLIFLPITQIFEVLSIKSNYSLSDIFKTKKPTIEAVPKEIVETDHKNQGLVQNNELLARSESVPATNKRIEWHKIFLGIFASVLLLALIVPILASSNPFFSSYLENFFQIFNSLNQIFSYIFNPLIFWRVLYSFGFWFYLSRVTTAMEKSDYNPGKAEIMPVNNNLAWFIPKVSVIAVLVLFFVSQIQFYLSPPQVLIELGYSYSRYVNEIFAQMSFVALVVFNLVFFDKFYRGKALIATFILILQGLFLLAIGLKSDLDYIIAAGLTFKRLYGLAIILWLGSVYVGFGYTIWQKKSHAWYLRAMSAVTLVILIGVNIANFDALIYRVNPARETTGVDYGYFSELSSDAGADVDLLYSLTDDSLYQNGGKFKMSSVVDRTSYLQQKYSTIQFQSFNLSEYLAYQQVKDLDLNRFRVLFKDCVNGIGICPDYEQNLDSSGF